MIEYWNNPNYCFKIELMKHIALAILSVGMFYLSRKYKDDIASFIAFVCACEVIFMN
jgi:hypothetical protein